MDSATLDKGRGDVALGETLVHATAEPAAGQAPRPMPTGSTRYARGRELGRGGMGQVFEATDQQFNRVIALKQATNDGAAIRRRFTTEAIVTGNLEHPGIPSVYERGVDGDGRPFYAMRRIQGRTLTALIAEADTRNKRLALLPIVTRVAQTIGFAHDRGVIHRDIKPDNVMVGDHGEVVVVDWGLARVRGLPTETDGGPLPASGHDTVYGAVVGTPAYMAPEQAAGEQDRIDERSDVFALGALLYHVLTGVTPYRGASVDELLDAARAGKVAPIASVASGIPRELVAICARATARTPGDRHQDAHELADALEAFTAQAVLGRPSRGMELAVNAITAVLVLFFFVGTYVVSGQVSSSSQQGWGSYAALVFGGLGCLASVVEWSTRGRYHLAPLSLALAGVTFLLAIGGVASGMGLVFGGAAELPAGTDIREPVAHGLYEVFGGLAIGALLTAFQLVLWAVARRRILAGARG